MRIGQTSLITFVSRVVASAIGFAGTIYFARELGATVLGQYSLVLAIVGWLAIGGKIGVTSALQKRLSEGEEQGEFFAAGAITVGGLFLLVSALVYLFRAPLTTYVGAEVTGFVVLLLFATLLNEMTGSVLSGHHLVHVKGLLNPVRMSARTLVQVAAVVGGLGLFGMLGGYAAGYVVVGLIGLWIVSPAVEWPSKRHFRSLKEYAQYSWIGTIHSRAFGWIDIVVLGVFVSSDLVGIYSVSWTIGTFFLAFGGSISTAIFPEVSKLSATEGRDRAAPLVHDALAYAGLIVIPGLVGAVLLGPRILRIYGTEFVRGTAVLGLLVGSCLVESYRQQLTGTLGAIDRPDYTFRVSALFVVANVVFNLGLVSLFGWVGAAVATLLSASVATLAGYYYLAREIDFDVPLREIGKQWVAALAMAGVVYAGLRLEETYRLLSHNFATVLLLVSLGAGVYFAVLMAISTRFRTTVRNNLPVDPLS